MSSWDLIKKPRFSASSPLIFIPCRTFYTVVTSMPPHSMGKHTATTLKSISRSSSLSTGHVANSPHFHTTLLVTLIILCLFVSLVTIRHFLAPKDRRKPHVVFASAGALMLGFTTVLVPSLDVYATSTDSVNSIVLRNAYVGLFVVTSTWLGFVLPFTFFYSRSETRASRANRAIQSRRPQHATVSVVCHRLCSALRSTLIYVVVVVVLLLLGLTFRPGHETWSKERWTQNWMDHLFDTKHQGTSSVLFLTGVLACAGCFGFVVYTAYGMATLPLDLVSETSEILNYFFVFGSTRYSSNMFI